MVKNLPSNGGDAALIPGQGNKIPHVPGQLNPGISIIEKPKLCNPKECSNYRTIALISHTSKVMLKILQARLQ